LYGHRLAAVITETVEEEFMSATDHGESDRRRSVLSVPAIDPHKTAKALASSADEVMLDLEDAVAAVDKDTARDLLLDSLGAQSVRAAGRVTVRVNAPRSPWCHLDLLAVGALGDRVASVVVPKVESAGDLAFVDRLLAGVEVRAGVPATLRVQALIETAAGLARMHEIAHASSRLDGLVLGYADLGASLGMASDPRPQLDLWLPAQQSLLVAARSAGVLAIDGPHLGVAVDDAFARSAARARDLGFDGKWAIHPRQIDALNDVFTPGPNQVRHAQHVLAALQRGLQHGAGAVLMDGQMLDEAVAAAARRVLARSS